MKCEVLTHTNNMNRDEWLDHRRNGIGGSEAAAVLGRSKWSSPYTVWADKTGVVTNTFQGNEATEWGNLLELPVAQRFAHVTNKAVVAIPVILRSIQHPFMLANCDYFIVEAGYREAEFPRGTVTQVESWDDRPNIEAILEIKTNGIVGRTSREWDDDGVPETYWWQGAHYAAVIGIRDVVFCALLGGQGLAIRERTYSNEQLDRLARNEKTFWQCVEGNIPPEAIGVPAEFDVLKAQFPESVEGVSVEADDFSADLVREYAELQRTMKAHEERLAAVRARIEQVLGSAESLTYEGETLVTYKSTKARQSLNTKALAAAHPAIVAEFTESKPGSRVLRVKEAK
jgi:putative phage-type endonuclease